MLCLPRGACEGCRRRRQPGARLHEIAASFRAGRAYKVRGLDCAEEVAVLKQAVGPLVGGADRLAFDVLNGRMTVAANENEVVDEAIFKAVAVTGMTAVPWTPYAKTDDTDSHRPQQVLFTAAAGLALLIGFALQIALAVV
jgi:Zn2+/Cd2+-exporting ATPase